MWGGSVGYTRGLSASLQHKVYARGSGERGKSLYAEIQTSNKVQYGRLSILRIPKTGTRNYGKCVHALVTVLRRTEGIGGVPGVLRQTAVRVLTKPTDVPVIANTMWHDHKSMSVK